MQTKTAALLDDIVAGHPKVRCLIYPGRPDQPQADIIAQQMRGGSTLITLEIALRRLAANS